MTTPGDFFTDEEQMQMAHLASIFSISVRDQETFDDFLFTIQAALSHEEATRLLAMAAAIIANASQDIMRQAAAVLAQAKLKASEN